MNSQVSMKGHSGVFTGGWLPVFWTSDASSSGSSVQLFPWRPRERGQQDLQLNSFAFQRGRCLNNGGALTLPDLFTGGRDCEVGHSGVTRETAPSSTSMAASSPGDEPETGAMALSEGALSVLDLGGITASAPWSSGSSLSGTSCSGMSS